MESDLVTIRRFHFLGEAQVVRGFLESAGIPCFVSNQVTASHHSIFSGPMGGVGLQVRRRDVDSAEELLQQVSGSETEVDAAATASGSEGAVENMALAEDQWESQPSRPTPICPSCGLGEVLTSRSGRECRNCGYRW